MKHNPRTLHEARKIIASLGGSSETPKTLTQAREIIARLSTTVPTIAPTIAPKVDAEPKVPSNVTAPVEHVAGKLVTSNLNVSPTFEQITEQLQGAVDGPAKLAILQKAEQSYRAEAKKLASTPAEQVAVLRKLQSIQRAAAVQMLQDKEAWKRRYFIKNDVS
jgi:hypothetical protein